MMLNINFSLRQIMRRFATLLIYNHNFTSNPKALFLESTSKISVQSDISVKISVKQF